MSPELPLSRQPACHLCGPHEHHILPCDSTGCDCDHDVAPGLYDD